MTEKRKTTSWTSTTTCIIHHNAIPIFVDIDWDTMLIDPAKTEVAITPKTKAILSVHYRLRYLSA
jgi:dTDP-4-amino-4,6-dideoxygalactose transaminase